MKRMVSIGLALGVLAGVSVRGSEEGDDTEAVQILKKADEATKKVSSASYSAEFKATGARAAIFPTVEGKVLFAGATSDGQFKNFRFEAKVTAAEGDDGPRLITTGSDGENFYVIDHKNKKVYEDIDPGVMGRTGRPARNLGMLELVHSKPFTDEINGESHELKESVMIGDQDCYQIKVTYANNAGESIWFFAKKDYLPRGVTRVWRRGDQKSTRELRLTNLIVDPPISEDAFKLQVPAGFEKIDDFAP